MIDVTPKKWMEDPLYYTEEEGGDWKKFEGPQAGRTVHVIVLPDGNVFDASLGRFREQFDPVKMAEIRALFESLPEGLGDDQPQGE